MKWTPLTDQILPSLLESNELAVITRQRDAVNPDPVLQIIADTAADIRSRVASSGRLKLSHDESAIPSALVAHARAIIRYDLLTRFNLTINEARTKQYEASCRILRDISSGDYVLTDSTDTTPSPSYKSRPQRWGWNRKGTVL